MTPKAQREADRKRNLERACCMDTSECFSCCVCLDFLPKDEIFTCKANCAECCRDCAASQIASCVFDLQFPVRCPCGNSELDQNEVGSVLDETAMARYLHLERYDYARKNPRCFVCPRPSPDGNGCPGMLELDPGISTFVCPVCMHKRCVECDVETGADTQHPGSCEQYQSWRRANESSDESAELYLGSDAGNRVRCPTCRVAIERESGCNHMRCVCGAHFCMECREAISGFRPYEHFIRRRNGRTCSLFPHR